MIIAMSSQLTSLSGYLVCVDSFIATVLQHTSKNHPKHVVLKHVGCLQVPVYCITAADAPKYPPLLSSNHQSACTFAVSHFRWIPAFQMF